MKAKNLDVDKLAKEIVDEIGGKENIAHLTHCVTRLRFRLKDDHIPDRDKIKAMEGVAGLAEQGGQFQIIIGNKVTVVYDAVMNLVGNVNEEASGDKSESEKSKNPISILMGTISEIFTPILGVFTACGVLLGITNVISAFNLMPADCSLYVILYAIANAFYYFMPIILGATAAEKFGINKFIGILVGGAMIHPNIVALAGVSTTLFGLPLTYQNYSSTVFPVIVTVLMTSVVYKAVDKICPGPLKLFLPVLVSVVISVMTGLIVIAPVVNIGGNFVSSVINALYSFSPVLCALALGGPWMILVMFGLHWAIIPIMINNIATIGYDSTLALLCAGQFTFATSTLAIAVKTKNAHKRELAVSTGLTCFLGVSEPCMYGILIPEKRAFATAIIASSLASVPAAIFGSKSYVLGGSGIFAFPSYIAPTGLDRGFTGIIMSVVLGVVLGFVLTYFFGMNKKAE